LIGFALVAGLSVIFQNALVLLCYRQYFIRNAGTMSEVRTQISDALNVYPSN
jgi:hypothetical protein